MKSCFCAGQTVLWEEQFNYADGTVQGEDQNSANPEIDWTASTCHACIDTADWWQVRSGRMEARDVNQLVSLETEVIDISGFTNIQFSLDISETGDHEGYYFGLDACMDQDKEDYVNVFYRLDSDPWVLIPNYLNWCGLYDSCNSHTLSGDDGINSGDCRDHDDDWGATTVHQTNLVGNTLQLRVELINSSTDERISLDNIVVSGDLLLPVRLRSFKATKKENLVLLEWSTATETDNDYFQVYKSNNNPWGWKPIGKLKGAGQSDSLIHYAYKDLRPGVGKTFYRIKQIDFDGRSTYSNIVSVDIPMDVLPYPNPTRKLVIIPSYGSMKCSQVRLLDTHAKQLSIPMSIEGNSMILDLGALAAGQYILSYRLDNYQQHLKIFKLD
jgi:hypothetical protein